MGLAAAAAALGHDLVQDAEGVRFSSGAERRLLNRLLGRATALLVCIRPTVINGAASPNCRLRLSALPNACFFFPLANVLALHEEPQYQR
jgi:hypothetical protein